MSKPLDPLNRDVERVDLSPWHRALAAAKDGKQPVQVSVVTLFQSVDEAYARLPAIRLACEGGCSYCCHYHVLVRPDEAFAIADAIRQMPADAQKAAIARLEENVRMVEGMTVEQHINTNVRCALLNDEGRCSVYALRPFACRRHHSVDGISCKVTFDNPSSQMQNRLVSEREALSLQLLKKVGWAIRTTDLDANRYEMQAAVLAALRNPAALKRWRAGKLAFPEVRDRTDKLYEDA